jgi:hypothetical protein
VCEFVQIPCDLCQNTLCRGGREVHMTFCPMAILRCALCDGAHPRKDAELHRLQSCPNVMIDCPYRAHGCGQMLRSALADHLQAEGQQHALLLSQRLITLEEELRRVRNLDSVRQTHVSHEFTFLLERWPEHLREERVWKGRTRRISVAGGIRCVCHT